MKRILKRLFHFCVVEHGDMTAILVVIFVYTAIITVAVAMIVSVVL